MFVVVPKCGQPEIAAFAGSTLVSLISMLVGKMHFVLVAIFEYLCVFATRTTCIKSFFFPFIFFLCFTDHKRITHTQLVL